MLLQECVNGAEVGSIFCCTEVGPYSEGIKDFICLFQINQFDLNMLLDSVCLLFRFCEFGTTVHQVQLYNKGE